MPLARPGRGAGHSPDFFKAAKLLDPRLVVCPPKSQSREANYWPAWQRAPELLFAQRVMEL